MRGHSNGQLFGSDYQEISNQQERFEASLKQNSSGGLTGTKIGYQAQFQIAIINGNLFQIKRLLKKRSDWININHHNLRGYTALQEALFVIFVHHRGQNNEHFKVFDYLLMKKRANINIPDNTNKSRDALGWACFLGQDREVNMILIDFCARDVDYRYQDSDGNTYLHLAVLSGKRPITRQIALAMNNFGICVDSVVNNDRMTPYLLACRLGYLDIAEMLEEDYNAITIQFDDLTFSGKDDWTQVGHKERLKQQKVAQKIEMEKQMVRGQNVKYHIVVPRKPTKNVRPIPVMLPSICLFTTDEQPAETGIDSCGRNWTFLMPKILPEMSNLSELFFKHRPWLKKQAELKTVSKSWPTSNIAVAKMTASNGTSPDPIVKKTLPKIMEQKVVQDLPSWRHIIDTENVPDSARTLALLESFREPHSKLKTLKKSPRKSEISKRKQSHAREIDTDASQLTLNNATIPMLSSRRQSTLKPMFNESS